MTLKKIFFLIGNVWFTILMGQEQDSLYLVSKNLNEIYHDCEIVHTQDKLKGHRFASAAPIYLIANNKHLTYAVFQLGKRKRELYLYIKILDDNVCLKKNEHMDIIFSSGETLTLKNEYPVNCEGIFIRRLQSNDIEKIQHKDITIIKIYSYNKDYEFYVSRLQDGQFDKHIYCLRRYKIE